MRQVIYIERRQRTLFAIVVDGERSPFPFDDIDALAACVKFLASQGHDVRVENY